MSSCVEFVSIRRKTWMVPQEDAYELRPDRPAFWLQRLCCAVLRKLGAFRMEEQEGYQRISFDKGEFMQRLLKQRAALKGDFNREPKVLLIGAEDFCELMRLPDIDRFIEFDTEYRMGGGQRGYIVIGLRVQVVPWMRGAVVMP